MAYALNTKSPLTLRLRHSNLQGSDELMLTKRQIVKIQNSIANGTGTDIKISKTQISKTGNMVETYLQHLHLLEQDLFLMLPQ